MELTFGALLRLLAAEIAAGIQPENADHERYGLAVSTVSLALPLHFELERGLAGPQSEQRLRVVLPSPRETLAPGRAGRLQVVFEVERAAQMEEQP